MPLTPVLVVLRRLQLLQFFLQEPLQLSLVVVGTALNAVGGVEATAGGTEAAFNTAARSLSILLVLVESGPEESTTGEEQEEFEKKEEFEEEEEVVVVVGVVSAVFSRGR